MTYEDTLRRLGDTTAAAVRDLFDMHTAGLIDTEQLRAALVDVLALAGGQGAALGEMTFAAYMQTTAGTPPAELVTGQAVAQGAATETLTRAVDTVLEGDSAEWLTRATRLAFSESVKRSQTAFHDAMIRDERVDGWTRGLDTQACELCQWWSADGRIWPKDHRMPTHPGCVCTPVPTSAAYIPETEYTRKLRRTRAAVARAEQSQRERQNSGN